DEQLLKYLPDAEVIMAIQQSEAIKHMVSADIGLGCLSQHVIEGELATGKLVQVQVAGIDLARTWWLVWHKARHQSPIWQTFINIIQDS
ncbi:MAG TPA: LysR substrate-binding domain-containing protein, partial [Psychrobacter sp.]|uniref:LysR substrate-binding domain-containing protein n=1 Tax=Psychrobacter sp. TaxID=56811 RepID=UPI002BD74162